MQASFPNTEAGASAAEFYYLSLFLDCATQGTNLAHKLVAGALQLGPDLFNGSRPAPAVEQQLNSTVLRVASEFTGEW